MSLLGRKRRRDIGLQRWQFIAVLVTVVLGVALFAGMFNAYLNLGSSLQGTYDRLVMADMTITGPGEGLGESVEALPGVAEVLERAQADIPFATDDHSFLGRVVGMPPDRQPSINQVDILEGTYLVEDEPTQVLLEEHAADSFELSVGDSFEIAGTEVSVVGVVASPEYLWPARDRQNLFTPPNTFGVAFVHESWFDNLPAEVVVDQLLLRYDEGADRPATDEAVRDEAEAAGVDDVQTLEDHPSNAAINLEINALETMALVLPLLFLTAAGMAIYVVVTRLVLSQRGVIGTLRASGFSRPTLSRHYLGYGVGLGLVGAAIGAVAGGFMGRAMTVLYTAIFGIPDLVAEVHFTTIGLSFAFGGVAGALSAVAPARLVSGMAPAEAMRGDAPAEGGKLSIFERLVPPLRRSPVRWRMVLRGIGRNRSRSTAMFLGVILGLVLVLAAGGALDTMLGAFDRQFNEVQLEDAQVIFSVPVGEDQVSAVEEVDDVRHAEPVIGTSVRVVAGPESYVTLLEGYRADTEVHGFDPPLPDSGLLVGRAMGDLLGIEPGDVVTVEVTDLDVSFRAEVVDFVDELATLAYMDRDALLAALAAEDDSVTADTLAAPTFTTVKAQFSEGTDPAAALVEIEEVDGVAAAVDTAALRDLMEEAQEFFFVFVGMALVFGGVMAFALVFNIISVNIAERTGEFASMRANGLTHRKVAALIGGETLLLTLLAIPPGLLAGFWAASAFMATFSSDQFPITAQVRPATFVLASMTMLVVAGLSLWPAIRKVKRINVGEVVRERAV